MIKPSCVIVDDETIALKSLKSQIQELDLLEIEKSYLDPDLFLVEIGKLNSEIIFLDMDMPIMGDEVARKLKNKKIIFVSGHVEHAIKGFEVNAVDFVPKPVRLSRLKEAIQKALIEMNSKSRELLVIKTQDSKKEEIVCEYISHIECHKNESRDKLIQLKDGSTIHAKNVNFETILAQLPEHFLRVNTRQIINLNFAYKLIDSDTIGLKSESKHIEINLGDTFKNDFFSAKPHFK